MSNDPPVAARAAAAWLAAQVTPEGAINSPYTAAADPSLTAQAVIALAAAGVGGDQVDAMLGYLGTHLEDFVSPGPDDNAGSLALLILAVRAAGRDAAAFGAPASDLVARLLDTQQASGLFGAADATYDGSFRQSLALLALDAVGETDAAAVQWLADQQCDSGLWAGMKPCPGSDPANYAGPDTNSTALAAMALHAHGADVAAASAIAALEASRNVDGGWSYIPGGALPTDASSTGLVVAAFFTVDGVVDASGTAALIALQSGCDADAADRGGLAFSAGSGLADPFATVQGILGLAPAALPLSDATIAVDAPDLCAPATTTTTAPAGPTAVGPSTVGPSTVGPTTVVAGVQASIGANTATDRLPATGRTSTPLAAVGIVIVLAGGLCLAGVRRRLA